MTYNVQRNLYFQGVDPKKLEGSGDLVLLCGGLNSELRDIFLIPWKYFFQALKEGEPVNTYKPPKEYWQYKFKIEEQGEDWQMTVQGGRNPEIDISHWCYEPYSAIAYLKGD